MRTTKPKLRPVTIGGERFYQVTYPSLPKGRARKTFKDKKEAKTFLDLKCVEITNHGIASASLGTQERAEYLDAVAQLAPYGLSLRSAVQMLLPQLKARQNGLSVEEAVKRVVESKRKARLSERHTYTLENRLGRFAKDFPTRPLASFTMPDVEGWLNGLPVGAQSQNHYKAALHSLFAHGVKLGACTANPVAGIDTRKVVRSAPSILSPSQLAALLTACADDAEMQAFVAIGAFAGLRTAELQRLRWQDVNLRRGFVTVGAQSAKTSLRRLVPICDALREWLEPIAKTAGPVAATTNFRRRFLAVRKAAGLADVWEGNELRHSYATFRLAETQDAAKTALEMGNSPGILLSHYRELATPQDAVAWFAVKPQSGRNIVRIAA
jgi:integrase